MKFLSRLFRWRPTDTRIIFTFHDGTGRRSVDPVAVWESLESACGCDPAELLHNLRLAVPLMPGPIADDVKAKKDAAARTLADAAIPAFGVAAYADDDGRSTGLTRSERVALVSNFVAYLGGLAVKARPFAGSRSPTAASPSR